MDIRDLHCDQVTNEELNTDNYIEITTPSDLEDIQINEPIYIGIANRPPHEYSECQFFNGYRVSNNQIIIDTIVNDPNIGVINAVILINQPVQPNSGVKYYKKMKIEPMGGRRHKKKSRRRKSKRRKSKRRRTRRYR